VKEIVTPVKSPVEEVAICCGILESRGRSSDNHGSMRDEYIFRR